MVRKHTLEDSLSASYLWGRGTDDILRTLCHCQVQFEEMLSFVSFTSKSFHKSVKLNPQGRLKCNNNGIITITTATKSAPKVGESRLVWTGVTLLVLCLNSYVICKENTI